MTTMIEIVARRVLELSLSRDPKSEPATTWQDHIPDAISLIKAMQTPTLRMVDHVLAHGDEMMHPSGGRIEPRIVWGSMINTALEDRPAN